MIKKRKIWCIISLGLMFMRCLGFGVAYGQSSPNYTIPWDVLDGGGGTANSSNYALSASIGQPSGTGNSSSSSGIVVEASGYCSAIRLEEHLP